MVSTPQQIGFLHIYWKGNKSKRLYIYKTMHTNSADTMDAKIGSIAPDFKLMATNGQEIALSDFRGKKNVILFFIRETY